MYRFEKKATLVCAAASLITACCLPLSANVAFAQVFIEGYGDVPTSSTFCVIWANAD